MFTEANPNREALIHNEQISKSLEVKRKAIIEIFSSKFKKDDTQSAEDKTNELKALLEKPIPKEILDIWKGEDIYILRRILEAVNIEIQGNPEIPADDRIEDVIVYTEHGGTCIDEIPPSAIGNNVYDKALLEHLTLQLRAEVAHLEMQGASKTIDIDHIVMGEISTLFNEARRYDETVEYPPSLTFLRDEGAETTKMKVDMLMQDSILKKNMKRSIDGDIQDGVHPTFVENRAVQRGMRVIERADEDTLHQNPWLKSNPHLFTEALERIAKTFPNPAEFVKKLAA